MPAASTLSPTRRRHTSLPPIDPRRYAPTAAYPVRAKARRLAADTHIEPHSHPWGQLAFSVTGVVRMTAGRGTYIVPPSRAVWIPPNVEHVVTVVEEAELRTLYLHQDARHCGPETDPAADSPWRECRVVEVSSLLRELVMHLSVEPGPLLTTEREHHSAPGARRAAPRTARPIGVDLPNTSASRPVRSVLDDPTRGPRSTPARAARGPARAPWRGSFAANSAPPPAVAPAVLLARPCRWPRARFHGGDLRRTRLRQRQAFTAMVRRSGGRPQPLLFVGNRGSATTNGCKTVDGVRRGRS